jgi:hypothetical protein
MPSSPEATTRVNAKRTVAREGRKSLSAPTSRATALSAIGRPRDLRPCATNRSGCAVMTEGLCGATVPSRTGRSWRGRAHQGLPALLRAAGCELTDADATRGRQEIGPNIIPRAGRRASSSASWRSCASRRRGPAPSRPQVSRSAGEQATAGDRKGPDPHMQRACPVARRQDGSHWRWVGRPGRRAPPDRGRGRSIPTGCSRRSRRPRRRRAALRAC